MPWIVERDLRAGGVHQSPDYDTRKHGGSGYLFRLVTEEGGPLFIGLSTVRRSRAPLEDWGRARGCTGIEYFGGEKGWVRL